MNPIEVPSAWRLCGTRILHSKWRRIALVGGPDTGKSTLCSHLAARIADLGQAVALLDADIG